MAASSLLALIDDLATLLDDVAVLTKVAATKTTGVMGDDLALNAEQVSGVRVDRELPVVWAVAKGSFVNKLILVPGALLISALLPVAIMPLMIVGGLFLCFEGVEKLAHKLLPHDDEPAPHALLKAVADPAVDLVAFERAKVKGAVRSATYPDGFHMLLRDLGRALPVDDIAAFVFDPAAPLPSGHEARAPPFLAPQD